MLTADDNYFENFEPGAVYKHARGKTVTENEAVTICHMVMNTASGHFDDHLMKTMAEAGSGMVDKSLVFGGVTISITIGLAHQDTGEQVLEELGLDNIKLTGPVVHGDTLYAYTEILEKTDVAEDRGRIRFRHYGVNQREEVVFQGERTALLRKRPARQ